MTTFEIDGNFEVEVSEVRDQTIVRIKLWGSSVYSQTYPFSLDNKAKVSAAISDTKRDFLDSLIKSLRPCPCSTVFA